MSRCFAPDGLADDTVLPGSAPDAALFTGPGTRALQFQFMTGSGPGMAFYNISTDGVSNAAIIPLPAAAWLYLWALAMAAACKRAARRTPAAA